jgi:signal transduction histidine kinase
MGFRMGTIVGCEVRGMSTVTTAAEPTKADRFAPVTDHIQAHDTRPEGEYSEQAQERRDAGRVERVLATGRALLAGSFLAGLYIEPIQAGSAAVLARVLLFAYCAYSLGVLCLLRVKADSSQRLKIFIHGVDILWAGILLVIFAETPYSPFVIFLVFPLLTAAVRWGFRATMISTAISIAVLAIVAKLIDLPAGFAVLLHANFGDNRLTVGGASLLILGFLIGYLGEQEKHLRSQAAAISRIAKNAQASVDSRNTMRGIFDEVFRALTPRRIVVVMEEVKIGKFHMWNAHRRPTSEYVVNERVLESVHRASYFFSDLNQFWSYSAAGTRNGQEPVLTVFDDSGKRVKKVDWKMSNELLDSYDFESLLSVPILFGENWRGRVFIFDPGRSSERDLHFLADLLRRLSSVVYTACLQLRLRSRATAEERARVGRELHDGVIQSLAGMELRIEVLRRQCTGDLGKIGAQLEGIQQILRRELLNLRDMLQQMRQMELEPARLVQYLASSVETFQRDSGISAAFLTDLREVEIDPYVCYEIARITQEGLANVRKHSRAREVIVRFTADDNHWILILLDDGLGFGFEGTYSIEELDSIGKGPTTIKDRVRAIGGNLTLESWAGGARLEITLPKG